MLWNVHDSVFSDKFSTKIQCNKFLVNNAMSQVANEFVASDSDGVRYFMSFFSVIVIIHSHPATTLMLNI